MRRGAALVLLLASFGCGYALEGHGVSVDPSIKRVAVPLFEDETGKTGLDEKITRAVTEELLRRHLFEVVQETEGADAVVEGTLLAYDVDPVGFGKGGADASGRTEASRYAVVLRASVRYAKPGAEQPIWENESFTLRDEYDVGEDAEAFFDREDQALDRLAESFAKSLVSAMLEAF